MNIKNYRGPGTILTLTEHSVRTTELRIFELAESLADYVPRQDAERLRQAFVDNNVEVRELTNLTQFPAFTGVKNFDKHWSARHVPTHIYKSAREFLVYDDVVACYWVDDGEEYGYELHDQHLADVVRGFFDQLWGGAAWLEHQDGLYKIV